MMSLPTLYYHYHDDESSGVGRCVGGVVGRGGVDDDGRVDVSAVDYCGVYGRSGSDNGRCVKLMVMVVMVVVVVVVVIMVEVLS